jgi:hypothetical protein
MSWNYRIVRYRNGEGFGLHEVFYDDFGLPWGMTENPAKFVCSTDEGPAGINDSLLVARVDAIQRPVFDEPEEGKWPGKPPAHEESRCADETPAQSAPAGPVERHPGPWIGPDAELARACAMAAIKDYGTDDPDTHQRILKDGIWNDHVAVQAALAAIHNLRKATSADMQLFQAIWPTPRGIARPDDEQTILPQRGA